MAAPNLLNITTITGKIAGAAITTSLTAVINNSINSNKLIRINSIVVSNIHGTNNADCSVTLQKSATTDYYIASTVSIPADTTLVLATKDMNLYLEENDAIRALASAVNHLQILISYEDIS